MARTPQGPVFDSSTYRAYLIRLWRDRSEITWRASAQNARTGEITHFESLHTLFAFLERVTTQSAQDDPPSD